MKLVQTPELEWIALAKSFIGVTEYKGKAHNPNIIRWLKELGGWWNNDEEAWCGTFIAYCLKETNRPIPQHWYRALAYKDIGVKLDKPAYGCIGVKSRKGGGHVTFIIGRNSITGKLYGLGGNQNDQVNIAQFDEDEFEAFIWPSRFPLAQRFNLPTDTFRALSNARES